MASPVKKRPEKQYGKSEWGYCAAYSFMSLAIAATRRNALLP